MRIIPLEIGRLDTDLMSLSGTPGRSSLPVPSWLIEHPRGIVLFDTGLHTDLRTDHERVTRLMGQTGLDFPDGEELSTRIANAGFSVDDIAIVIFSHLHFDHCGGTCEIPNARIVLQEAEWTAGHHPRLVEFGVYDPADFDLGHDRQLINGVHDVFGDGTIVCIPTPGHTRGHQSLRVELASGPVVLTGDCVYFEQMLTDMKTPPNGANLPQQLESMRALIAMREAGCRLLFGHDERQFRTLPASGLV